MNLFETFDSFDHSLLITKLEAYGFKNLSLEFMKNYLTNREQIYKVAKHFSIWRTITSSVPQGSILGQLVFNISVNDIFFMLMTICIFLEKKYLIK